MNEKEEIALLKQIVSWLRFQSIDKAKTAVDKHLDTDQKKAAFEMTDGLWNASSLASKIGVSNVTIGNWWEIWFSAGMLVEHDKTYKKLFSLSDLGIEAPAIARANGDLVGARAKKEKK